MDVAIGVDAHKETLAAAAVDGVGRMIAEAEFRNDGKGHKQFLVWVRGQAMERRIGIEGSGSFGAGLARMLLEAGEDLGQPVPRFLDGASMVDDAATFRPHPAYHAPTRLPRAVAFVASQLPSPNPPDAPQQIQTPFATSPVLQQHIWAGPPQDMAKDKRRDYSIVERTGYGDELRDQVYW